MKFVSNMQICSIEVQPVHYGLKKDSVKDERKSLTVFLELIARTGGGTNIYLGINPAFCVCRLESFYRCHLQILISSVMMGIGIWCFVRALAMAQITYRGYPRGFANSQDTKSPGC